MSFINSVKNFIGIETDDDYYDDDYYDEEDEIEEEDEPRSRRTSYSSRKSASKVVPINPASSSRVRIVKPSSFEDSKIIADEIKGGRLVIFDVGKLNNTDARRVVDFVSGAAYGVNGNVKLVSGLIFVAAPRNIDITGDSLKEHTRNALDWDI